MDNKFLLRDNNVLQVESVLIEVKLGESSPNLGPNAGLYNLLFGLEKTAQLPLRPSRAPDTTTLANFAAED